MFAHNVKRAKSANDVRMSVDKHVGKTSEVMHQLQLFVLLLW